MNTSLSLSLSLSLARSLARSPDTHAHVHTYIHTNGMMVIVKVNSFSEPVSNSGRWTLSIHLEKKARMYLFSLPTVMIKTITLIGLYSLVWIVDQKERKIRNSTECCSKNRWQAEQILVIFSSQKSSWLFTKLLTLKTNHRRLFTKPSVSKWSSSMATNKHYIDR